MKVYSYSIWPRLVTILLTALFAVYLYEYRSDLTSFDMGLFAVCFLVSLGLTVDLWSFQLTVADTGIETTEWFGLSKRLVKWEEMELMMEGRGWPKLHDYVILTEQSEGKPLAVSRLLTDQPEALEAIVVGARQVQVDNAVRTRLRAYKEKKVQKES
ncbi:MAG: hypothetical protein ACM3QZ_08645 [Solirubrobacterales bacterium]